MESDVILGGRATSRRRQTITGAEVTKESGGLNIMSIGGLAHRVGQAAEIASDGAGMVGDASDAANRLNHANNTMQGTFSGSQATTGGIGGGNSGISQGNSGFNQAQNGINQQNQAGAQQSAATAQSGFAQNAQNASDELTQQAITTQSDNETNAAELAGKQEATKANTIKDLIQNMMT